MNKIIYGFKENSTENTLLPDQNTTVMPQINQDSAMMICYKESLSSLEKFSGGETSKIQQFIIGIERIGRMIEANDNILYCMLRQNWMVKQDVGMKKTYH